MACFSGFRPFLTKGSTLNGVQNTFFANSVNGVHYVPDATDVYGTTSLATFNEGISGVLDEKNGVPVAGPNLITNGDFSNGTTGWSAYTTTMSVVDGRLRVVSLDNDTRFVGRSITTIVGKSYELSFDYDCGTATNIFFATGPALGSNNFLPYTIVTGLGTIKRTFTVNSTTTWLALGTWVNNSGKEFFFDNVSIKELPGSPSVQTTVAARPLLGRAPASRRNLLTYSQDFRDASTVGSARPWGHTYQGLGAIPTVTPNYAVAPDGTNTATRLQCSRTGTGGADRSRLQYTVTYPLGATLSRSLWVKSTSGANQVISISDSSENNSVNTVTVGSEWQRITITYNALLSANGNFWIGLLGLEATVLTADVLIWGAQFELGSTVTAYQRVDAATDMTESGVTSYPFIRMDLSDDVLTTTNLVSAKNLLRFTEEFDSGAWIKSGVFITPNNATAPDGTQTADKIVATNGHVGGKLIYQSPNTVSNTHVYSFYAKAAEYYLVRAIEAGNFKYYATFNLNTGVVSASGGSNFVSAQMLNVGNGWYRCAIFVSATAPGFPGAVAFPDNITPPTNVPVSYTGDGVSGAYFWGAQLELGTTLTDYDYGGIKGTVIVAGRSGTSIDIVTLPDGVFTLGPTTYTGGTPGILRTVGDIVGYTLAGRTTTSIEQDQLIDFYKFRGAKGRLIGGPELITNGDFSNGSTGWITFTTNSISIVNGQLKAEVISGSDRAYFGQSVSVVAGKYYEVSLTTISDGTSKIAQMYVGSFWSGVPITPSAFGSHKVIYAATTTGTVAFWPYGTTGGTGTYILCDNISVKELRPEEEW